MKARGAARGVQADKSKDLRCSRCAACAQQRVRGDDLIIPSIFASLRFSPPSAARHSISFILISPVAYATADPTAASPLSIFRHAHSRRRRIRGAWQRAAAAARWCRECDDARRARMQDIKR
jgi:hypothetical protein